MPSRSSCCSPTHTHTHTHTSLPHISLSPSVCLCVQMDLKGKSEIIAHLLKKYALAHEGKTAPSPSTAFAHTHACLSVCLSVCLSHTQRASARRPPVGATSAACSTETRYRHTHTQRERERETERERERGIHRRCLSLSVCGAVCVDLSGCVSLFEAGRDGAHHGGDPPRQYTAADRPPNHWRRVQVGMGAVRCVDVCVAHSCVCVCVCVGGLGVSWAMGITI